MFVDFAGWTEVASCGLQAGCFVVVRHALNVDRGGALMFYCNTRLETPGLFIVVLPGPFYAWPVWHTSTQPLCRTKFTRTDTVIYQTLSVSVGLMDWPENKWEAFWRWGGHNLD